MSGYTIDSIVQLESVLVDGICRYLDNHHGWDHDRVVNAAVAMWLMQQHGSSPDVVRVYLDKTFAVAGGEP